MPNKDLNRIQSTDPKVTVNPVVHGANPKNVGVVVKTSVAKPAVREAAVSPGAPAPPPAAAPAPPADDEATELLGSLTTQQQQRTSARVIKKLRLEPPADRRDTPECDTPNKMDDKELPLKFPTVKQRMPKALWSADEKNLFFEALNEYGKDFDAITAYICGKMKKKGMNDANLKTKTQVSHFYYRTWHKLSKHVHFDENVNKVAQELYALINYGELRKKLVSVNEKTCSRLGEMVAGGSMVVRLRGRNLRVRTPMCRALRRLNQLSERLCGLRVWSRLSVSLRARDAAAWARVQAAAHNPRACVSLPLRARLHSLIRALHERWKGHLNYKLKRKPEVLSEMKSPEEPPTRDGDENCPEAARQQTGEEKEDDPEDIEKQLGLETDRIIVEERSRARRRTLHLGPRAGAAVQLPVLQPGAQLSSAKICFSSYLERMGGRRDAHAHATHAHAKIRTPKRQRKDSATDKEIDQKKHKPDEAEPKLMDIDETAVDGIELMANYKSNQENEEKPSTEDEMEIKFEEIAEEELEKEKDMSERDKDISERDKDMSEKDKDMSERDKDILERDKDSFSEMEDDEKYNNDTDNESDGRADKADKHTKFKNLKVKFRIRPRKRGGGSVYTVVAGAGKEREPDGPKAEPEEPKVEPDGPKAEPDGPKAEPDGPKAEPPKEEFDVDTAIRQVRKGWSMYDAGDLTIGDLYLMFGSRSKLELDYWWAEPTPPLPRPACAAPDRRDRPDRPDRVPDAPDDDRERRESDTDILSPHNAYGQDSNDGLSGDERKGELLSPEHKAAGGCSLKLASKLVNRPLPPGAADGASPPGDGFSVLSDRLKRLLALAGNPLVGAAPAPRCRCGHVCTAKRAPQKQQAAAEAIPGDGDCDGNMFRHPTPIAPKPDTEPPRTMTLDGLPRWRRGRPRGGDRRVVVQRLLPLLPKQPPPSNLIPVKLVPNGPPPLPRLLPRPPGNAPDSTSEHILMEADAEAGADMKAEAEAEGQPADIKDEEAAAEEDDKKSIPMDIGPTEVQARAAPRGEPGAPAGAKTESQDLANFLPSESLSLSPSRLLRGCEADGWLGAAQDFSLSSFLQHLEGRPQPDLAVDSHLHSLMAESSVDYVAKFADLAAEVTDEALPLAKDLP